MSQSEQNRRMRNAIKIARAGALPGETVEIECEGVKVRYLGGRADSTPADSSPHRDPLEGRLDAVDQKLKAKAVAREATARS